MTHEAVPLFAFRARAADVADV